MQTVITDRMRLREDVWLRPNDVLSTELQIRERIFDRGINANGQQMARARAFPRGRYRYDTGELFRGFQIRQKTVNVLEMVVKRTKARVIIRSLERRYGPIFRFSAPERRRIQELATKGAARLRRAGFDPARRRGLDAGGRIGLRRAERLPTKSVPPPRGFLGASGVNRASVQRAPRYLAPSVQPVRHSPARRQFGLAAVRGAPRPVCAGRRVRMDGRLR